MAKIKYLEFIKELNVKAPELALQNHIDKVKENKSVSDYQYKVRVARAERVKSVTLLVIKHESIKKTSEITGMRRETVSGLLLQGWRVIHGYWYRENEARQFAEKSLKPGIAEVNKSVLSNADKIAKDIVSGVKKGFED